MEGKAAAMADRRRAAFPSSYTQSQRRQLRRHLRYCNPELKHRLGGDDDDDDDDDVDNINNDHDDDMGGFENDESAGGDSDYLYCWERLLIPIARQFKPELTIISAGFDAARSVFLQVSE